ncbi:copper uptake system-associated protein [Undibacterium umbellatum]|uniref:Copper uptake system-associated protein n=1 Tax=Undibacterium umbellatum TaxID=2762300 RepID=A0ABR6Z5K3_9BURK|nr:copper uptake system-associated protein [Undibacterium umbellatum]MBC3907063.1 copper uptake system-associated protein [Undibacterium umbellatum]
MNTTSCRKKIVACALTLFVLTSGQVRAAVESGAEQKAIQMLISHQFDQPGNKVDTAPIAVVNDVAIADWIQADRGGRALLRRFKGKWEIIVCGGDGLKDINALKDAGIPESTAKALVSQLNKAEQGVSPDKIKKFGLFGSNVNLQSSSHSGKH